MRHRTHRRTSRPSSEPVHAIVAGFEYLQSLSGTNGKVGATGFCYGGGVVNKLAVAYPEMAAGVPFYGAAPDSAQVAQIEAPLMIQLAALDQRINAMWPGFQKALEENDKRYKAYIYPGVNHGFHNDTTRQPPNSLRSAWWPGSAPISPANGASLLAIHGHIPARSGLLLVGPMPRSSLRLSAERCGWRPVYDCRCRKGLRLR